MPVGKQLDNRSYKETAAPYWSSLWSTQTFIKTTTMIRLQRVSKWCDGENGAGGEEKFLVQAPLTNQTQALQPFWDSACHCQQAHLFHSLFLTHKPHLSLPLIALQWLRAGASLLHAHWYSQRCYRGCDGVWGMWLLSVTSTGKVWA